ncbi:MAG: chromosome segregation protein SMC [Kiritimatiellae bacterium]|nr:chromosome segregation protein SMC [Kiritimatiellia bacterium]
MYLKCIELIGFKSFAGRTQINLEPGMTAIVGPNGCGKSNVSDAIRWVLGEQSAKALRGSCMEDCIFNGTDTHKPLGMAEVSLTLADCEQALGTEFHEITVTRRVFRTGEGQYFINRAPCRLKDIQRLFMDTGIGTNSYSLMEQGRIDQILSSRPEDRREVFEEASGITKYKADKKEAIRKLEHTEANLQRLADIIREVRRQIISLQRQAGKAKRYKAYQERLRSLDLFVTRERLAELDRDIQGAETRLASVAEQHEALHADMEETEKQVAQGRTELQQTESEIAEAMDAAVQARAELDRTRQLSQINRDRIDELRMLSERDTRDVEEARSRIETHLSGITELSAKIDEARAAHSAAEQDHAQRAEALARMEADLEKTRQAIHELQAESVDLESRHARLQNEISALEAHERSGVVRKERLFAEQSELQRTADVYNRRQQDMAAKLAELGAEVERHAAFLDDLVRGRAARSARTAGLRKELGEFQARAASRRAQIELLTEEASGEGDLPAGARAVLEPTSDLGIDPQVVLGTLSAKLDVDPPCRTAVEAVLRASLDAVIISDDAALMDILRRLEAGKTGPARLVAAHTTVPACLLECDGPGEALAMHVRCDDNLRPLVMRLLHNVRVVETFTDIPFPALPGMTYVTMAGAVVRGDGSAEYWIPNARELTPFTRRHLLAEWQTEVDDLERQIAQRREVIAKDEREDVSAEATVAEARARLDLSRHGLAVCEGENQVIADEATQARDRAETVEFELNALTSEEGSGENRRTQIQEEIEQVRNRQADVRAAVASKTDALRSLDHQRSALLSEVTDSRIRSAERRQQVEHLDSRREPLQAQIRELETLIQDRTSGISSYHTRIADLERAIAEAEARFEPLENEARGHEQRLEESKRRRQEKNAALSTQMEQLRSKRAVMDEVQDRKSKLEVELAQQRMRRQNMLDRVTAEYRITADAIAGEPEPQWEDGARPDREALETEVAEIRAKMDSMGPVNLVAIEELEELQQRAEFLTQQQDDLTKAKQQLMDLIRKINKTTTEMFSQTFNQVNENFQMMFKRLFGDGSAKLVLIDEEDVLESGIEIIARPPGKKLQTVSLLSGGERTLTAVALLFSLYMVKPSAFCVLDELDAALDDANIGRFIQVLQGFLDKSQFVVITHSRQTISAADVLYGVTMEERGISKIVSVKFSDHEKTAGPAR